MLNLSLGAFLLALTCLASADVPRQSLTVEDEINAANSVFMELYASGNAAALAELYTENAVVLASNQDFVTGKNEIQALMQNLIDSGLKSITLITLEAERFDDTATEMGRYIFENKEGQIVDEGKYLVIWKLTDGQWKFHRDMFNSSESAVQSQ
jgi:ketosteroid isomerase-like protein